MAEVTSGTYKLDFVYTRGGDEHRNVYWYSDQLVGSGFSQELADAWFLAFNALLQAMYVDAVEFQSITVEEVGTTEALGFVDVTGNFGDLVGEAAPTFISVPFQLKGLDRSTRAGAKRIGPMTETELLGDFFTAGYMASADALATAMAAPVVGGGRTFFPVLVKRSTLPNAPALTINFIQEVVAINRVTSQVTRKRGVGS